MIAHIRGRLILKEPNRIVVDVNGVGYQIFIPLSTYYQLPEPAADVSLHYRRGAGTRASTHPHRYEYHFGIFDCPLEQELTFFCSP